MVPFREKRLLNKQIFFFDSDRLMLSAIVYLHVESVGCNTDISVTNFSN